MRLEPCLKTSWILRLWHPGGWRQKWFCCHSDFSRVKSPMSKYQRQVAQKPQLQRPKGGIETSQEKKYHLHTIEQTCPCVCSSMPLISSLHCQCYYYWCHQDSHLVPSVCQIQTGSPKDTRCLPTSGKKTPVAWRHGKGQWASWVVISGLLMGNRSGPPLPAKCKFKSPDFEPWSMRMQERSHSSPRAWLKGGLGSGVPFPWL